MAEIDQLPGVRGSWVDYSGAFLKVRADSAVSLSEILERRGMKATPMAEAPAVKTWYGSADTLQLSDVEAKTLAKRWANAVSDPALEEPLAREIAASLRHRHDGKIAAGDRAAWQEEMKAMARRVCGDREDLFQALLKAMGYSNRRP